MPQLQYKMPQLPWCHWWAFPPTHTRSQAPSRKPSPNSWFLTCRLSMDSPSLPSPFWWSRSLVSTHRNDFSWGRASWVFPPWVEHSISAPTASSHPKQSTVPTRALVCLGGGAKQKELRVSDCESSWQWLSRWPRPSHLPLGFRCLFYLIQSQKLKLNDH